MNGSEWPSAQRRHPSRRTPTYAVLAPLSRWLQAEAAAAAERHPGGPRVLDVGCGVKPYYPFFAGLAAEYVGVDVRESAAADLVGPIEKLPVPDESFDVVLCTQVLEHTADPGQAVRELRRVTAPGGRVLASTHGVYIYHPTPLDLWRWTHAGLERLFAVNGEWQNLTVRPGSGTTACVAMVLAVYVDLLARRAHAGIVGRGAVAALNSGAAFVDGRFALLREPRPGTLFANYHVTAVVP